MTRSAPVLWTLVAAMAYFGCSRSQGGGGSAPLRDAAPSAGGEGASKQERLSAEAGPPPETMHYDERPPRVGTDSEEAKHVSLVQLIATPDAFRGQQVLVMGFVALEFEGNAVYLHRDDFVHGLTKNGLWLELRDARDVARFSAASPSYAIVEGRFSPDDKGHMGLFSGALHKIRRLSPWEPRPDGGR